MRGTRFLTTCVLSAAFAALSVSACSSDSGETDGDGGSGGTTTDTSTTSGTTTPTNTSTNTNTNTGDGNDSFDTAQQMTTGEDTFGTLEPVDEDVDYYVFSGNAGDFIWIDTAAKPETDPFSPEYPDLVVALYDASENQIAENDDPFLVRDTNDSEIYTILPSTGDYYIKVQDCLHWENGGADNCAPAADIVNFEYGLRVNVIDPTGDDTITMDPENGDDLASAVGTTYTEDSAGDYFSSIVYGTFNDNSDIDVFSMTIPNNLAATNTPMLGVTFVGPEGPSGCGTTNNVGMAWIEDDAGNVVSIIDHSLGATDSARDLRAPVTTGAAYNLFLEHPGTAAGSNDFYIAFHHPGDSNPGEQADGTNGDPATPESLTGQQGDVLYSFFVQGTMDTGADVDHFLVDGSGASGFDASTWTLAVACGAERSGSGLRGLSVEVLESSSPYNAVSGGSGTETPAADLFVDEIALGGSSQFLVKLTSGTPDANVSSRYYMCGMHFQPPLN